MKWDKLGSILASLLLFTCSPPGVATNDSIKSYPRLILQESPYDANGWDETRILKINPNKNESIKLSSVAVFGGRNLGGNSITTTFCYAHFTNSSLMTNNLVINETDGSSFTPEIPQGSNTRHKWPSILSEISPWGDYLVLQGGYVCGLFVINLRKNVSSVIYTLDADCLHVYRIDWFHGILYLVQEIKKMDVLKIGFPPGGQPAAKDLIHTFTGSDKDPGGILGLDGDFLDENVYWMTSKSIFKGGADGSVVQLIGNLTREPALSTLQYYAGKLYWIQSETTGSSLAKSLAVYDIQTGSLNAVNDIGLTTKTSVFVMVVYEDRTENITNGCDQMDCSHICLPLYPSKYQCVCPWGLTLVGGNRCEGVQFGIIVKGEITGGNLGDNILIRDLADIQSINATRTVPFEGGAGVVKAGFARRTSEKITEFCYMDSAYTLHCVDSASGRVQARATKLPRESPEDQIISVRAVKETEFVVFLSSSGGCLKIYESVSKNTWTLTCSEGLGQGQIAIDFVNWILFWEGEKRVGFQTNLISDTTEMFRLFDPSGSRSKIPGNNIAVDSLRKIVYTWTKTGVNGCKYDGGQPFTVYIGIDTDGQDLSNFVFSGGKLFWIAHFPSHNVDFISILDPTTQIRTRVVKSDAGRSFALFVVFTTTEDELFKSSSCGLSKCSHFCVLQGENKHTCFCPQELPVLINATQCIRPKIAIETKGKHKNGEHTLALVSSLNNLTSVNHIHVLKDGTDSSDEAQVYFATEAEHICKSSAFNSTRLKCQNFGNYAAITSGQNLTQIPEILAVGRNGSVVFSKSPQTGCVQMSWINSKEPIKTFCVDLKPSDPFVIDTVRYILFWCNEKAALFLSMDVSDRQVSWLAKQPGWDEQCKSLAVNEFRGELYLILGKTILLIEYSQLLLRFRREHEVVRLDGQYEEGLQYWADNLFWIDGDNGPGEFISVANIERSSNGRFLTSGSLRRVYLSPGDQILQIRIFEPSLETKTWSTSCSELQCPGICLLANALPPLERHPAICYCPPDVPSNDPTCVRNINVTISDRNSGSDSGLFKSNIVILMYAAITVGILALIVAFVLGRWHLTRKSQHRKFKRALENFIKGDGAGADSATSFSEKAFLLPFTKIVPPESISMANSKVLGEGNFGIVYEGKYNDESVALKTIKLSLQRDVMEHILMDFIRELKVMQYIGAHAHIVVMYGAEISGISCGKAYVVLELSPLGSLHQYLRKLDTSSMETNGVRLATLIETGSTDNRMEKNLNLMVKWSSQIANGMGFLAEKHVVHGDLATRNVLVFDNGNMVKISDFGLSRRMYQSGYYRKKLKTPLPFRWAALETLERREFSTKADAWSYGVTVWEIFTLGNLPYPQCEWDDDFVMKLKNGMRLPKPVSDTLEVHETVMMPCWSSSPENRPTFLAIQHFFDQYLYNISRDLGSYENNLF